MSRKKKKNRDKTTATADELGRGADDDNEETSTKKSSASISPRSGHVSSDLDTTLDESSPNCHHAPHSQRNGKGKTFKAEDAFFLENFFLFISAIAGILLKSQDTVKIFTVKFLLWYLKIQIFCSEVSISVKLNFSSCRQQFVSPAMERASSNYVSVH